jgi:Threonine dehydrogenase and related Zn-dependent dehydrogenases
MKGNMRFGVIVSDKKAEVHEHEVPSIKPKEVLIQNRACNICTTDYQQWLGLRPHQPTPMAFGHENSGVVVEVGSEVQNTKVGDHVVVDIYGPCLECDNCRKGKSSLYCENSLLSNLNKKDGYGYYGFHGCGQYQVAQSKHVFRVSKDLPFESAGFCEPLATVVHGIHKLRVQTGDRILVIGAGTMGALNAQTARHYGADVIVSEISEKKLETTKSLGFEKTINVTRDNYGEKIKEYTEGEGLDAILIVVGVTQAYNQAIKVAPKGCKFLIFAAGYPAPKWNLDPNSVHYNSWEITGTYGCSTADYQEASTLLSGKKINVDPLIEKRFPLEDVQKAFEKAATPDTYRTSVTI